MKKINILVSTLAIGALFVSCEDNRLQGIPENKVYMARSGLQTVPFYNLNRPETMQVSVVKSGYYNVAGSATIDTVGQFEIDQYNKEFSTNIIQLPDSCYSFKKATLAIGEKDLYGTSPMTVKVPSIDYWQKANVGKVYGVPVKMLGASLSMTKGRELSIFSFQIKPAVVSFVKYGEQALTLNPNSDTTTVVLELSLPFKNDWDLACEIEESEETFNKFNQEKGNVFARIPAGALLNMPTEVIIPKGKQSVKFSFLVLKSKAGAGFFAFVPTLKSVTPKDGSTVKIFPEEEKDFFAATFVTASDLSRKGWTVKPSPHTEPNEGSEGNLLDDDMATYWHSKWSGGTAAPVPANPASWQYVIIDLGKNFDVGGVKIAPRNSNATPGSGHISDGAVELSQDNVTFTPAGSYSLTTKAGYQVFPLKGRIARYIKVIAQRNYGQFAEISAMGAEVIQ